jgi:hypothetical protein
VRSASSHSSGRDRGAALLIVMVAAAFIAALALAMVMVVETERRIEGTFEWSVQARESAEAGAERVMSELSVLSDWSAVLNGSLTGVRNPNPGGPMLGGPVNLGAVTLELQSDSNGRFPGALNRPIWRLFESGGLSTLTGATGANSSSTLDYVAIWVADDPWESDNDPTVDGNGVIGLHVEAWGAAGARATVDATLAHGPPMAGCVMAARWNYDSDRSRLSVLAGLRLGGDVRIRPGVPGIVLAAWQGSSVDDPCHAQGPGIMIVTWREVG